MAADPFGSPDPLSVAPDVVTELAARVVTPGTAAVVNERTVPTEVPTLLEASAQK